MQPTNDPGPLVALAQTLEQFPRFLFGWFVGTTISLLSDPLVFCLALGTIAFGFVFGVVAAIALFFVLYTVLRTLATLAHGVNSAGQNVGQAIVHSANVQLQQAQPIVPPETPSAP